MKIYLDNTLIDNSFVVGLTKSARLFNSRLKLGSTVCREITISILNEEIHSTPEAITFKTDANVVLYTVYVDEIDETNEYYTTFTCLDKMVKLNELYDFGEGVTAQDALDSIYSYYSLGTAPVLTFGDQVVSYDGYTTARDFIGYCAETEASYAYIDENGDCQFDLLNQSPADSISLDGCSSLKVGHEHYITRIVYDDGVNYIAEGDSTGDTIYLNTNNILFTSDSVYQIEDIVAEVNTRMYGFDVYNIEVEQCNLTDLRAGQILTIGTYNTIVEEKATYNGGWLGGYILDVESSQQEETQVVDASERAVNSIRTEVNRLEGTLDIIGERTTDLETQIIHFQVDANNSEVRVTNQSANPPTSYTSFKGDGMRIYVDGNQVAEATAQRFECNNGLGIQDWAMEQGQNSNSLILFRKA